MIARYFYLATLVLFAVSQGIAAQDPAPPPPSAQQQSPQTEAPAPSITLDGTLEILAHGDVRGQVLLTMTQAQYAEIKRLVPDPALFLRDLKPGRADFEMSADSVARYDDQRGAVVMNLCELGAVRNLGKGRWALPLDDELEFLNFSTDDDGRTSVFCLYKAENPGGVPVTGQALTKLPKNATNPGYDAAKRLLVFQLPEPEVSGSGELDVSFEARSRIMAALYKIYGLETDFAAQWVGKTVFRNTGSGLIKNLRVRYRVDGYSDWSLWQKYPEIVPGQTVVSAYYPVLSRDIAALHSTTPANVRVEYQYDGAAEGRVQDEAGERIAILGIHEFVFSNLEQQDSQQNWADANSNAPFLAAWISRDDPIVSRFASLANKLAGGEGAPYSDEAAYKVLKASYELWLGNDFTYQGPKAIQNSELSFDCKIVQSMRFPREVIRDKSGTCIELTALYCSMAHSVGLKAFMILIPGHAFPVVRLPSGKLLALESTGVAGGLKHGARSFEDMVQRGAQTLEKAVKQGLIMEIDAEALWAQGVSNPELPEVGSNALTEWGIVAQLSAGTSAPVEVNNGVQTDPNRTRDPQTDEPRRVAPPGPGPGPGPGPAAVTLTGTWTGTATEPNANGGMMTYAVTVVFTQTQTGYEGVATASVQMPDFWGNLQTIDVSETYSGTFDGQNLRMQGTRKSVMIRETGQQLPTTLDALVATLTGGQLNGRAGTPQSGFSTFSLQRVPNR